jgi:hypothetical protein
MLAREACVWIIDQDLGPNSCQQMQAVVTWLLLWCSQPSVFLMRASVPQGLRKW